jgi:hypothetical protein
LILLVFLVKLGADLAHQLAVAIMVGADHGLDAGSAVSPSTTTGDRGPQGIYFWDKR